MTDEIFDRAIEIQGELAKTGRHRIPLPDLLIAATAESADLVILHYDADFETLAEVTGQPVEWVVERGSVQGVDGAGSPTPPRASRTAR